MKRLESKFFQFVKTTSEALTTLNQGAQKVEGEIHPVFEGLNPPRDERLVELLTENETIRHQKEKALLLQKEELEFLVRGMRDAVAFSERLMNEGSMAEIVFNCQLISSRLSTLLREDRHNLTFQLVTDPLIVFEIEPDWVDSTGKLQSNVGRISTSQSISIEQIRVSRATFEFPVNQNYYFEGILVTKGGEEEVVDDGSLLPFFDIKINGEQRKDIQLRLIQRVESKGVTMIISFPMNKLGQYEISALFKGNHFQGSPFRIRVVEEVKRNYHRDYESVTDSPLSSFYLRRGGGMGYVTEIACNWKGEIFITEALGHYVKVFDQDGKFLFKFGKLSSARGLAIDHRSHDQIVVADCGDHCLKIFDERGDFIRSIGSQGENKLKSPMGVAVDQNNGNYLVTDGGDHCVQIFNSNGEFVRKFGSKGKKTGQFESPAGIGILSNGHIVVGESGNNRVQIFNSEGNFVRILTEVQRPNQLFVDSDDNILVAAYGDVQIQILDKNGKKIKVIPYKKHWNPTGVSVDPQGRIIAAGYWVPDGLIF